MPLCMCVLGQELYLLVTSQTREASRGCEKGPCSVFGYCFILPPLSLFFLTQAVARCVKCSENVVITG